MRERGASSSRRSGPIPPPDAGQTAVRPPASHRMPRPARSLRWARLSSAASALAAGLASGCSSTEPPELLPISAEETRQLFLFSHVGSNGYAGHGFVIEREGKRPLGITAFHVAGPITN